MAIKCFYVCRSEELLERLVETSGVYTIYELFSLWANLSQSSIARLA